MCHSNVPSNVEHYSECRLIWLQAHAMFSLSSFLALRVLDGSSSLTELERSVATACLGTLVATREAQDPEHSTSEMGCFCQYLKETGTLCQDLRLSKLIRQFCLFDSPVVLEVR
jgi:hypothetical protein